MSRHTSLVPCVAALLLVACAAPAPKPEPPPAAPGPMYPQYTTRCAKLAPGAPNDNLNAVLWFQTAAEFRAIATQTFQLAGRALDDALRDPAWSAMPRTEALGDDAGQPPAVIVDIDETMLDNSPHSARRISGRYHDCFDPKEWLDWTSTAQASSIPGALAFAQRAEALGVRVFYISNRDRNRDDPAADELASTRRNLEAAGFPMHDDNMLLRDRSREPVAGWDMSDKRARRRHVDSTHRVLLLVGDNLGDFVSILDPSDPAGKRNLDLGRRAELVDEYKVWWGERWFALPNPMYGSWEGALDPAGPGVDDPGFRRAKHDHLDTR
jgi:acid phosphatase